MAVNESLEFVYIHPQPCQEPASIIVRVSHHSKEKVVRTDSVTAGAHGFFPGITDDAVQFIRYLYFHILQY